MSSTLDISHPLCHHMKALNIVYLGMALALASASAFAAFATSSGDGSVGGNLNNVAS